MPNAYSKEFYSSYAAKSYLSATAILPLVKDLIAPTRVVDVGCGTCAWLRAWEDMGVSETLGIDGNYVDRNTLLISKDKFIATDLSKPTALARSSFDLAQSLEVAEHLPPACASDFIRFLCSLSPVVLFSAAIPHQGGVNHVNEQWPEYWAALFSVNGYAVFDVLRSKVWHDEKVEYYYAQNIFLYVNQTRIEKYPLLTAVASPADRLNLSRVHPRTWEAQVHKTPKLEELAAALPKSTFEFGKRALRRIQRHL